MMAEPKSPLEDSVHQSAVTLRALPQRGMISLKGDLGSRSLKRAVASAAGVAFPAAGRAVTRGDTGVLWMAPDELLLLSPRAEVTKVLEALEAPLGGLHYLAADVSDARVLFSLDGEDALVRETLARLTPADLHTDAFQPGDLRRTRLSQVAAAIWFYAPGQARVIAFRSVAGYVFDLLANAADGRPVGHFK